MAERKRSEEAGRDPSAPQEGGRGAAHRVGKLMPGGTDVGAPLSPTEARKARAQREHFEVAFEPTPLGLPTWSVRSSSAHQYRVVVPAFPDRQGAQCNCPDFLTRGLGTCKHLEATLAQAAASPPEGLRTRRAAPTSPELTWGQVEDRRSATVGPLLDDPRADPARLLLALRRAGRLLTE